MPTTVRRAVLIRRLRTLLAPCALFALWACSHAPPPNIVIIVLDTARPDYLSAYGHSRPTSPYLETFAKQGTRYDRAYSVSNWTLPAHASLFSGRRPEEHCATQASPKISDAVPMMADRLAHAGYQTAGFSNNPWVTEPTGLARGFQHFRENEDKSSTLFASDDHKVHRTVADLTAWFSDVRRPEAPFFVFVNLIEPHMPYMPTWEAAAPFMASPEAYDSAIEHFFPDARAVEITNRHYAGKEPLTPKEWSDLRALYEGELRTVDDVTRQLMELVDAHSDPKETIVFVISDHGENLGDHGHLTHVFNLYDSNLRIVCLARGPGFDAGAVEKRLVQITDLYPTVMAAARQTIEPGCDGLDLRGDLPTNRYVSAWQDFPVMTLGAVSEEMRESGVLKQYERELFAAVGPRFKLISGSDESQEAYDLSRDPNELQPLEAHKIQVAVFKSLMETIAGARATKCAAPAQAPPELTDEQREMLRKLGYIGEDEGDESPPPK